MAHFDLTVGDRLVQSNPDAGKIVAMRQGPKVEPLTVPINNGRCGARCRSIPYSSIVTIDEIHIDEDDVPWVAVQNLCQHQYAYSGWVPIFGLPNWTHRGRCIFKQIYDYAPAVCLSVRPVYTTPTQAAPNTPGSYAKIYADQTYGINEMLKIDDKTYLDVISLNPEESGCSNIGWVAFDPSCMILEDATELNYPSTRLSATCAVDTIDELAPPNTVVYAHDPYGINTSHINICV